MARGIKIGKDRYELVVLKVVDRDVFGRPHMVQVGYDDTTFKLEGGEHFVTAYISKVATKIETKGTA